MNIIVIFSVDKLKFSTKKILFFKLKTQFFDQKLGFSNQKLDLVLWNKCAFGVPYKVLWLRTNPAREEKTSDSSWEFLIMNMAEQKQKHQALYDYYD